MAGSVHGFQPHPQRPSLSRRAVGAALMQQGQAQPDPTGLGLTPAPGGPAPGSVYEGGMGPDGGEVGSFVSFEDQMATTGMRPGMAVPAAAPDATAAGPRDLPRGEDSAITAAVRAAEMRSRNGASQGLYAQPKTDRSLEQLARLGLSPLEIQLLQRTGAVK